MKGGVESMKTIKLVAGLSFVAVSLVAAFLGVRHADARLSSNAKNLADLIAVNNVIGGNISGTDNLGELIVLSSLFPTSLNANQNAKDLAGLIAVNNVTGGGSGGTFTGGTTDLGELIVLSGLFGGSGTSASTMARNLAGLIAVENVTGGGNSGGTFSGGTTDLAELLVLNGLFLDP